MSLERLSASVVDRYAVEREIGAGGMATVYLAHDRRHDRPVAIKLFRPELSAILGGERFLNEIKVTANLQHPHILALYDSGSADGLLYYVMPFVEGESLRQRLERERQLPIADAVRIAREVADALDYAHRHGVIHRDVKPENILLHDGRALVADFGIALAVQNAGGNRITETGLSLGTPQYMSPEQATAERELDGRSDVYSLGCVLYEMLAGEPPHTGPTTQSVITKIVTDKARPITELRETVPAPVAAAIHRALAKVAADRFASAGEFAAALAPADGASTWPVAMPAAGVRRRGVPGLAVGGLIALGLAAGWLIRGTGAQPTAAAAPTRLTIPAPSLGGSGASNATRHLELTPDGTAVIYVAAMPIGGNRLMVHRLDALAATELPGGANLYAPRLSRDGRWLHLRDLASVSFRLPMEGGSRLQAPAMGRNAYSAWHPDGSLWFSKTPYRTLERVPPDAGDTAEVRFSDLDGLRIQDILDDGKTAVVMAAPTGTSSGPLFLFDLGNGSRSPLLTTPVSQARVAAGHLVVALPNGALLAAPFDSRSKRTTAEPVQIASGVAIMPNAEAQFAVSANGTVVFVEELPRSLVFVDRAGRPQLATRAKGSFHSPRFSPDGRRVATDYVTADGRDVWVLDLDQETLSRVTFDRDGHDPVWTPDGLQIAYLSGRSGPLGIYAVRPGSGAPAESLFASPAIGYTGAWYPDGSALVTVSSGAANDFASDIVRLGNGGRGPIEGVVTTPFAEQYPALSADGRWLAYVSNQSGEPRVYARPLSGDGDQIQVSQGAGDEPVWNPRGGELFYKALTDGRAELVAARIETAPRLRVVSRQSLFPMDDYIPATPHAAYDVSPDGRTFVMVRRSQAEHITVIQNFPELVRRERTGGAGR